MSRTTTHKSNTSTIDDVFKAQERKLVVHKAGSDIVRTTPVKLRRTPVTWGIPMDETCFSLWFTNFMHLPVMPWDNIVIPLSTYLPEARNTVHNQFLGMEGCEWLLMLDSDVLPPPDILERLMAHKKDLVGGWYRKKGGHNEPVVYDYQPNDGKNDWVIRKEPGKGLERVGGAGAGCWLMSKRLAQAIGESPYNLERGGEDFELCRKVTEKGFEIFIDWSLACAHAGVGLV